MENRCKLDILSLLCPKISVFPFVSDSGLWAELIMANRYVFADGETGTEKVETVVETAHSGTQKRPEEGQWSMEEIQTIYFPGLPDYKGS